MADVLAGGSTVRDVDDMLIDLTQWRDHPDGSTQTEWQPVLSALLGVVRQYAHRRELDESNNDPSNASVRARIILALQAGVRRPTDIAKRVGSPPTVVSRALRGLVEDGVLRGPFTEANDRRFRNYEFADAAFADEESGREVVATSTSEPRMNVAVASRDARTAARIKPVLGLVYVPTLMQIGSDVGVNARVRTESLAVACMILRSNRELAEARIVAEQIAELGDDNGDDLVRATGFYEVARTLVEEPEGDREGALDLLRRANGILERQTSDGAKIQQAWVLYSLAVFTPTGLSSAIEYLCQSRSLFVQVHDRYGESACNMVLARFYNERLQFADGLNAALSGFEFADGANLGRIAAECALWSGSSLRINLLAQGHANAAVDMYLEFAERRFRGLGLSSWSALARSELILHRGINIGALDSFGPDNKQLVDACAAIEDLARTVSDLKVVSTSWAAAALYRRAGVLCRLTGNFERGVLWFDLAYAIHRRRDDSFGMTIALAGKRSSEQTQYEMDVDASDDLPPENGGETLALISKDPALELHLV
ncbi:hypothetical protein ACNHUS_18690 [Actinomycetes bacterium M1A6_2h]